MKKHHIFLLVISLLLVASLAFPAPKNTTLKPVIYLAADLDEIPSGIGVNDKIYIKKIMTTTVTGSTTITIKIYKKRVGQAPEEISSHQPMILVKGTNDDTPQEHYVIELPVGHYLLEITSKTTSGYVTVFKPALEIFSQTDKKDLNHLRQGDDGTY